MRVALAAGLDEQIGQAVELGLGDRLGAGRRQQGVPDAAERPRQGDPRPRGVGGRQQQALLAAGQQRGQRRGVGLGAERAQGVDADLHRPRARERGEHARQRGVGGRPLGAAQHAPHHVALTALEPARQQGAQRVGRDARGALAQAGPGGGRLARAAVAGGAEQGGAVVGDPAERLERGQAQLRVGAGRGLGQRRHRLGTADPAERGRRRLPHRAAAVGQAAHQARHGVVAPDLAGGAHGGPPHVRVARAHEQRQRVGVGQAPVLPAGDGPQRGGAAGGGGAAGEEGEGGQGGGGREGGGRESGEGGEGRATGGRARARSRAGLRALERQRHDDPPVPGE